MTRGHKVRTFNIDSSNIDKFEILEFARMVSRPQVNRILAQLKKTGSFESPLVVNDRKSKYRIIDGVHRIEAIKRYLSLNPDTSIEVTLAVYKNLNTDEERKAFTTWNLGRRQSSNDYIKIYSDTIPIWKMMEKRFPVPVKIYHPNGTQHAIHFVNLMRSYMTAWTRDDGKFVPHSARMDKTLEDINRLGRDDYNALTEFVIWFEEVFGRIDKSNPYTTTSFLAVITTTYYDGMTVMSRQRLKERFKKKIFNDTSLILESSYCTGANGSKKLYRSVIEKLNEDSRSVKIPQRST
ncbi:MAG: hypothetical protein DRN81_01995 [Thermoproteota archaeon]|nr:MAG: hypothetical protein DRN81_01995 [Candidatus Korarchaeota archaeon]